MKRFEEGVKHRWTLHFVHITLGIPTQYGFLQRPLISANVQSRLFLFLGQELELYLASSSLLQYPTATVTGLVSLFFRFLFSLDGTNMLQSQP
jgi:hypothetical protein